MNSEIKQFFNYLQSGSPFLPFGSVEINYCESHSLKTTFSEIYQSWFEVEYSEIPRLEKITTEEFTEQLAVVTWSCFGWPGKKPKTTQAQKQLCLLIEQNYGLGHIRSLFNEQGHGCGEITFEVGEPANRLFVSITWSAD